MPFQETAAGHCFGEDEYASESDDKDLEETRTKTDLEAIMASLHSVAPSVADLQSQLGT